MSSRLTVIDNETARLWYYPEAGIVHHQMLQPVAGVTFQNLLMTGLRFLKEDHATKWLSDDRANTMLPPEDGAWSQEYWLPRAIQAGWRYWAVLPPAKALGQVTMKRLVEFVGDNKVTVQIFADPDQAWLWLNQQGPLQPIPAA